MDKVCTKAIQVIRLYTQVEPIDELRKNEASLVSVTLVMHTVISTMAKILFLSIIRNYATLDIIWLLKYYKVIRTYFASSTYIVVVKNSTNV